MLGLEIKSPIEIVETLIYTDKTNYKGNLYIDRMEYLATG